MSKETELDETGWWKELGDPPLNWTTAWYIILPSGNLDQDPAPLRMQRMEALKFFQEEGIVYARMTNIGEKPWPQRKGFTQFYTVKYDDEALLKKDAGMEIKPNGWMPCYLGTVWIFSYVTDENGEREEHVSLTMEEAQEVIGDFLKMDMS